MRVLITGGAGFIGSHMAAFHLQQGHSVVAIDDLSTGNRQNIHSLLKNKNFSFYKKNFMSWGGLLEVMLGVDRIYHFAAVVGMFQVLKNPLKTLKVNLNGTLKLVQTIDKLGTKPLVLFASSSEVYGDQPQELKETSPLILGNTTTSHSVYAVSKLAMESIALTFWHTHELPCIVLRIFNTVGQNQSSRYGMVLPRFIEQAKSNEPITVFGEGNQSRSFCNVLDSVHLIDLVAKNPKSVGEIINLGHAEEITAFKLAQKVKKLCRSQSPIVKVPYDKVYHQENIPIKRRKPNLDKLLHLTDYRFQWSLEKTIVKLSEQFDLKS